MCTATNSAIPTAPVREEWHTRLTTPRRVSAGGSCGVRVVACAACQAAARPAPSTRGRTGSTVPASASWRTHAAAAPEDTRTANRRMNHVSGGGAPCAQRRRPHQARIARIGRVVRRICRSASAERALPPGRPRAGRSARRVRSTRAPTGRELARGKLGATWTTSEQFSNGRNGGT